MNNTIDVQVCGNQGMFPCTYKTVVLKPNIINNKNILNQGMMNTPNTKYVIKYDFTLEEDITIPADCVLEFDGGSLRNGNVVLQNTLFDGVVKLGGDLEFSGTCANQTAYQSWFENNDIDAFIRFINNIQNCFNFSFSTGIFNPTEYINKKIESNKDLNIIGNGCKLHYNVINVDTPYFTITPVTEINDIITLDHAVLENDGGISVPDATVFSRGEYVILRDYAISSFNYCRNYQQGEIIKIESVILESSRIVPDHFIYGNYVHVNEAFNENEEVVTGKFVKLLKANFINVTIKDFDIRLIPDLDVSQFNTKGVLIKNAIVTVDNFNCYNFRYGIEFDCCLNSCITNCKIQTTRLVKNTGDTYGLEIVGCQNILIQGCTLYGGRHAITISSHYGGDTNAVSRFITVDSCYGVGYRSRFAFNCHGGAEYVTFINCTADGISMGCNNYKVINNNIGEGGIESFDAITFNGVIENNNVKGYVQVKTRYVYGDYIRSLQNYHVNTTQELLIINNNNIDGDIYVYTQYNGIYNELLYANLDNTDILVKNNICNNMRFQLVPGMSMGYPDMIPYFKKSARVIVKDNRYAFVGTSRSSSNINCREYVVENNKIINKNVERDCDYIINAQYCILKCNVLESLNEHENNNALFVINAVDNIFIIDNINNTGRPIIGASVKDRPYNGKIVARSNKGILSYININSMSTTDYTFDVITTDNTRNIFNDCNVIYRGKYNEEEDRDYDTIIGNIYKDGDNAIIKFNSLSQIKVPGPNSLSVGYLSSVFANSNKTFKIAYNSTASHQIFGIRVNEFRTDGTAARISDVYVYDNSAYAVVVSKTWPRGSYYGNFKFYHDIENHEFYLNITESLGGYNTLISLNTFVHYNKLSDFIASIDTTSQELTDIKFYGNGIVNFVNNIPDSGLHRRSTGELVLNDSNKKLSVFDGSGYWDSDGAKGGTKRGGNTASRPVGSSIYIGFMYFDTSLTPARPIYASAISGDTVTWVDATGTPV